MRSSTVQGIQNQTDRLRYAIATEQRMSAELCLPSCISSQAEMKTRDRCSATANDQQRQTNRETGRRTDGRTDG